MKEKITFSQVKISGKGYLADGIFVPEDDSNKDYKEILEWIAEGNTPDPEFTEAEILQNAKDNLAQPVQLLRQFCLSHQ